MPFRDHLGERFVGADTSFVTGSNTVEDFRGDKEPNGAVCRTFETLPVRPELSYSFGLFSPFGLRSPVVMLLFDRRTLVEGLRERLRGGSRELLLDLALSRF